MRECRRSWINSRRGGGDNSIPQLTEDSSDSLMEDGSSSLMEQSP